MPKFLRFLGLILLVPGGAACEVSREISPSTSPGAPGELEKPAEALEKGDRRLEIHITDPENGSYDQSIATIKEIGAESVTLTIFWDEIEHSPGTYDPDPNWLEIANLYYPPNQLKVSLVISVLDTTEVRLPMDLIDQSLADPEVILRFHGLLDYIRTQIPDLELTSLTIGNEIDGVLGSDPNAWSDYQVFFEAVSPLARELWPGVPVGCKITFDGLTGPMIEAARDLNASADIVMATYYPLKEDFSVQAPDQVLDDFQKIVEIYPDQEIHFAEIGYPTSAANHSSPEKQADFIRAIFTAWDQNYDHIKVLSYSWLHDLPESSVRVLESYYGLSDPGFAEFLRTLGLRTYPGDGEDKSGFQAFRDEAKARGW